MTSKYGIGKAIIISSLLFGILHADPVGSTLFGIAMCLVFIHTRSIIFPILLHAINNFAAVIYSFYVYTDKKHTRADILEDLQSIDTITVGIIFFAIGIPGVIWLVKNHFPHKDVKFPLVESKKVR